jgi:hypothetical protein
MRTDVLGHLGANALGVLEAVTVVAEQAHATDGAQWLAATDKQRSPVCGRTTREVILLAGRVAC